MFLSLFSRNSKFYNTKDSLPSYDDADYLQNDTVNPNITLKAEFLALLKNRLSVEAEESPPLFPWENNATDIEAYKQ